MESKKRKRKNVKDRNPGLPLPSSCKSIIERIYLIQRSDKRKEVQVDLQKGVYLVGENGKRETKLRWESTKTDPVRLIEEFKEKARSKKLQMCADVSTFLPSSRLKDNGLNSAENLFARAADFTYLHYLANDEQDAKNILKKHGFVILELGLDSSHRTQMRKLAKKYTSKMRKIQLHQDGSKPRVQTPEETRPKLRDFLSSSGKFKQIIQYLGFDEKKFPIEKVYPQLIYSKCNREQKWHTDYCPVDEYKGEELNERRTLSFIFACGSAGSDSFLELKPYDMRQYVCCTIRPGTVIVFGNDVLHRGCEYREENIRLHCTVDHKDFKREEGKTVDFVHELMEASELAKMFDGKQYKATCLPKKRIL